METFEQIVARVKSRTAPVCDDANLIAEMLEALKDAQEALCWYDAEGFQNEHGVCVGAQVSDAIAKAEGR